MCYRNLILKLTYETLHIELINFSIYIILLPVTKNWVPKLNQNCSNHA